MTDLDYAVITKEIDKTPAQVAKADYPYKSWLDVVKEGKA